MAYKSRSGRLRIQIGQAKRTLSDRCSAAKPHIPTDLSVLDLDGLINARNVLQSDIEHVSESVKKLQGLDKEWDGEMKALTDDDHFVAEEKLYNAAAEDAPNATPPFTGYLSVLTSAETLIESMERSLRKILSAIEAQKPVNASAAIGTDLAAAFQQLAQSLQKPGGKCNLPKLELPFYAGKLEETTGFWQAFDVNVGSKSITDAEKMSYLLRYLTGEAKAAVSYYAINDANYKHAVDTLKSRFGDPKNIKILLRKKMNEKVTVPEDTVEARKIIESFEAICRQLEDLGENTNTIEFLVALRERIPFWIQIKVQELEDSDPTFDTVKCRECVMKALKTRENAERRKKNYVILCLHFIMT